MKTLVRFGIVAFASVAMLFSACSKDIVSSDAKIDTSKTATIKIKLRAQTDATAIEYSADGTATPKWQPVPAGATVTLTCPNTDLGAPAGTGGNFVQVEELSGYETIVSVPVSTEGANYELNFNEVVADYTATLRNSEGQTVTTKLRYKPTAKGAGLSGKKVKLYPGAEVVVEVEYKAEDTNQLTVSGQTARIRLVLGANTNLESIGNDTPHHRWLDVPAGAKLILTSEDGMYYSEEMLSGKLHPEITVPVTNAATGTKYTFTFVKVEAEHRYYDGTDWKNETRVYSGTLHAADGTQVSNDQTLMAGDIVVLMVKYTAGPKMPVVTN